MKKVNKREGITLIALIITIIVLLILAGITINLILGEDGIINRAVNAGETHKIEAAKEKLVLVLAGAQIEKITNEKYNQDEFLDELILKELPEAKILEDIVIVDGYAFTIDRSVPKIGEYVGKGEELVFPNVQLSAQLAEDYKSATITIKAKEEENGISKIEIIQNGFVLKEYIYENTKEEITANYTAKQNGTYIIKVYSKLTVRGKIEIKDLVSAVEYIPNGNEEYAKTHSTKIQIEEDVDPITSIKYQWLETIVEPEKETFTQSCENGATITKSGITGKWYLWVCFETASGKTNIVRSEVFYFDNTGPEVELVSTPDSETGFTLTATASDKETEIKKYEFYVNDELKKTVETTEETAICTITDVAMGDNYNSYVIVTDKLGNTTKQEITSKTALHTWNVFGVTETSKYQVFSETSTLYLNCAIVCWHPFGTCTSLCTSNGKWRILGKEINHICSVAGTIWNSYKPNELFIKANTNTDTYVNNIFVYNGGGVTYSSGCYAVKGKKYYTSYVTTSTQSNTSYGTVSSINSEQYPGNDRYGDYWYVYIGVQ